MNTRNLLAIIVLIPTLCGILLGIFFIKAMMLPNFLLYGAIAALFSFWLVDFLFMRQNQKWPRWLAPFACAPLVLVLCGLTAGLTSCTALGLAAPQSFDEQLAEAYGVHTAVVQATTAALTGGAITTAEASAAQTQEEGARAMLDAARAIETANPTSAASDLTLASAALSAVQTYLNSFSK